MVCLVPAGLVRSRDVPLLLPSLGVVPTLLLRSRAAPGDALRSQPLGRSRYAPGDALRSRCATLSVPNTAAGAVRCTRQWLHILPPLLRKSMSPCSSTLG